MSVRFSIGSIRKNFVPENFCRRRLWPLALCVAALLLSFSARAAEEDTPKKTLFLPKNPTAAAYVLNRLSNKELSEAPRSEFVYVALLQRAGLERKYRLEALEGLARARGTDALAELIGGIGELDKKGDEAEPVLRELGGLLLQNQPVELAAKRVAFEKLAGDSQMPLSRQISYAALITADGSVEKIWSQTETDAAKFSEMLRALPLLRAAKLREAFYPKVLPLLQKADPTEVRRAAITALAALPGHDAETFATLAVFVKSGTERAAAVAGLQQLPRKSWPKDQAESLIESLLAYLKSVPPEQRTEADAVNAFQFATDLSALLPPEKAGAIGKSLRSMGVSVFVVRTILEQMLYDKTLLVVEAGKPVEIILVNDDSMPHNLVVTRPGAFEEIGNLAEKMPLEPDAQGRLYVPSSPKVLHATKMVDPGQRAKLAFTAPSEPGDYQYVCTFPGHWRRMLGTLAVVPDVEAYLASHATTEPKITEWKVEDLAADLPKPGVARNLANGKDFFTKLACAQCHKLGGEGNNFGPELTDVYARYKTDRAEVLRQILEPSLVIAERYRNYEFELKNGDTVTGMIVKEDAESVIAQSGPSDALMQTLKKTDIKSRTQQASSLMPLGLLNALSKEQILDLLAYVEAGGKIPAHEHAH